MFVEGDIEVHIKDRSTQQLDEHELKLWLQRAFKNMACYRISAFKKQNDKSIQAVVALKISELPEAERLEIEQNPNDTALLRSFLERMFDGKGQCRATGDAKLRRS